MITNDQLLKLFVLVPSTVENFNGATVSGAANEHRIFFEESTGLIWAKGLSFGGNDSELAAIVSTLIGNDTNKSVRTIAGEVLSEAMDLADDADTTINNLTEVLKWFKNLPEGEEGALNLVGRITTVEGKITTLETTVGDSTSGLVKSVADNTTAIGQLQTTVGGTGSGLVKDVNDLKTTVGNSSSGLVKSVADINTSISGLDTRVTALEAYDPWENYTAPTT